MYHLTRFPSLMNCTYGSKILMELKSYYFPDTSKLHWFPNKMQYSYVYGVAHANVSDTLLAL